MPGCLQHSFERARTTNASRSLLVMSSASSKQYR